MLAEGNLQTERKQACKTLSQLYNNTRTKTTTTTSAHKKKKKSHQKFTIHLTAFSSLCSLAFLFDSGRFIVKVVERRNKSICLEPARTSDLTHSHTPNWLSITLCYPAFTHSYDYH